MRKFEIVKSKSLIAGGYSLIVTAVILSVIIAINLVVSALPSYITRIDVTDNKLFTISEQTKKILSGLTENVTIYQIAQGGSEDITTSELLERYKDMSNKITVEFKDSVLYPTFAFEYNNNQTPENGSLIVVSEKRYLLITPDMLNPQSGDYNYYDGEGVITSAIDYVTNDNLPIVYNLTGHSEKSLSDDMKLALKKENMELKDFTIAQSSGIVPEDASCVLILAPSIDFSETEKDALINYLSDGGRILLITNYTTNEMPNLDILLESCGIAKEPNIVLEGETSMYLSNYPTYILPVLNEHEITLPLIEANRNSPIVAIAQALTTLDNYRSSLNITTLLETSDKAYTKEPIAETIVKQDGDLQGPFALGFAVSEELDNGESKFVCFSTINFIDDTVNELSTGSNKDLFLNSLGWMCEKQSSITIHTKSLSAEYLTINAADSILWIIVLSIVLPLIPIVVSITIWYRRKRR